jgi:hypothetical protein
VVNVFEFGVTTPEDSNSFRNVVLVLCVVTRGEVLINISDKGILAQLTNIMPHIYGIPKYITEITNFEH